MKIQQPKRWLSNERRNGGQANVDDIKKNLIAQLTAPVRWTQSVQNMARDGAKTFIECGPGKVLQGLVKKIVATAEVSGL